MAKNNEFKKKQKLSRRLRLIILGGFLIFSTTIGIMHQVLDKDKWVPVGVDALCPFGGIESAYTLITSGSMLPKIAISSFILLGATILIAILFRRSFCGNICALGALQELFDKIGKILLKKRYHIPKIIDRPARYLKYALLIAIIILSIVFGKLIIRPYDPWATYHHIISADLFSEFLFGFIILLISIIGSVFYNRFFCKYLCPMGAFLGIINKIGIFRIKRNEKTCINCMACDKACPVNINIQKKSEITSSECLSCNECVNVCPEKDTLTIKTPGSKRHLSATTFLLISALVFLIVVGSTTLTGQFKWNLESIYEHTIKTGAFDYSAIKGRDTFKDVSDASGIPKEAFIKYFSLTEEEFSEPIKETAHKEGSNFDTADVRAFVHKQLESSL